MSKSRKTTADTVEEEKTETQEKVEETIEMKEEPEMEQEAVTYLGPSISNVVEHGTVFVSGNLTNIMKEQVERVPALKGLLVKTSKLVQAKKDLRNKDSALSAIYRKVEMEVAKNE